MAASYRFFGLVTESPADSTHSVTLFVLRSPSYSIRLATQPFELSRKRLADRGDGVGIFPPTRNDSCVRSKRSVSAGALSPLRPPAGEAPETARHNSDSASAVGILVELQAISFQRGPAPPLKNGSPCAGFMALL